MLITQLYINDLRNIVIISLIHSHFPLSLWRDDNLHVFYTKEEKPTLLQPENLLCPQHICYKFDTEFMPCQNSASRWTAFGWKSKLAGLAGAAKTGWLGFQFPPSSQPGWRKCGGLKVKSAYTQPSHHQLLGWDAKVSVWKVQGDGEGHFWLINYGELNLLFELSSYEAWFVLLFVH